MKCKLIYIALVTILLISFYSRVSCGAVTLTVTHAFKLLLDADLVLLTSTSSDIFRVFVDLLMSITLLLLFMLSLYKLTDLGSAL